jgi:hypothetical protein
MLRLLMTTLPPSSHDAPVLNMAGLNHPRKRKRTRSSCKRAARIDKKTKAMESFNKDIDQKAVLAYSLTAPFYGIQLSK